MTWLETGDIAFRLPSTPHRILALVNDKFEMLRPYPITLFITGPKVREWGFWKAGTWTPHTACEKTVNKISTRIDTTEETK